jgi:hypothetical protein
MEKHTPTLPQELIAGHNFVSAGRGKVCYIKVCDGAFAKAMVPRVEAADTEILFCLFAANGTPLTITTTYDLAIGVAKVRGMRIASLQ